jgi:hypothetical protein
MSTSTSALVSTRWVELGLAIFTALVGVGVMYGSYTSGIGWDDSGPQSGYFPFYIGLLLTGASIANMLLSFLHSPAMTAAFVSREAFRRVMSVFAPILLFVASMPFIGLYLASVGFIAWFMWRDRQREKPYTWLMIVAVSCGAALASYLIFSLWFQVPLDAGPLAGLAKTALRWFK